jgi:hypothetical protein
MDRRLLATLLLAACAPAGDAPPVCDGDKCDDASATAARAACDGELVDRSGRGLEGRIAGRLDDPFSKHVLRPGRKCPTTFADVMAKLKDNDKTSCEEAQTRVVSERSQVLGEGDAFRLIVTRACDGRRAHELIFSVFGVDAGDTELPADVEVVALDATRGVYNYYALEDGEWAFFGDSIDLLEGPGDDGERRCATCHPGGGLVMKELESPWLHWEGHNDTPGAAEFVERHAAILGKKRDGINMESLVRAGNRVWTPKRIEHLRKDGAVKDLLRPLFCTMDVNLDSGAEFPSPVDNTQGGTEIEDVPSEFLSDLTFREIDVSPLDYRALVAAANQRVAGGGAPLRTKDGKPAVDTVFDFAFPETGALDKDAIAALVEAGVIDDELRKDVLMVDFTRPVFSTDRCGLLELVPELPAAERTPAKLREGLLAALGSPRAGTPAAWLAANLEATPSDHDRVLGTFVNACRDRPKRDFMADALKVASLRRDELRRLPLIEFPETLPVDDLDVAPGTRLHPVTCELTTSLIIPEGGSP